MKIAMYILGGLVAIIVILGFAAPKNFKLERTIDVDVQLGPVFNYVKLIKNLPEWNAWLRKDLNAKKEFRGKDGETGAILAWESSDPNVGSGEEEIMNVVAWELVHFEVRLKKPFETDFKSYVAVDGKGPQKTMITLGMAGKMSFPMNVMSLIMNDLLGGKKNLIKDMDASLLNLKTALEKLHSSPLPPLENAQQVK